MAKIMSTALVYVEEIPARFIKYHNINSDNTARFIKFVTGKFPKAKYVNFYNKDTIQFIRREYVKDLNN